MVYLPGEKVSLNNFGLLNWSLTSVYYVYFKDKMRLYLKQNRKSLVFKNNLFFFSADWSLEALLYKWDMKCVHIPLESFGADEEAIAESALPGRHTVEMLVISLAKDSLWITPTSCFRTASMLISNLASQLCGSGHFSLSTSSRFENSPIWLWGIT